MVVMHQLSYGLIRQISSKQLPDTPSRSSRKWKTIINRWWADFVAVGRFQEEYDPQAISARASVSHQKAAQPIRKTLVENRTYAVQQHRRSFLRNPVSSLYTAASASRALVR